MAATIQTDIPLIYPDWNAPDNVLAYSTTRRGGLSGDSYRSLNVGLHVNDHPNRVHANRAKLPFNDKIHWMQQVHGNSVVHAQGLQTQVPTADAIITDTPDVFCAVMTADCIPVLLCNQQGTQVAAIHAGWRGLACGVIQKCVSKMAIDASELIAWIGPCISQSNYEVDDYVHQQFPNYTNALMPSDNGRYLFDLSTVAAQQLAQVGVKNVFSNKNCTYRDEAEFFSHRRTTQRGEKECGRQVCVIGFQ